MAISPSCPKLKHHSCLGKPDPLERRALKHFSESWGRAPAGSGGSGSIQRHVSKYLWSTASWREAASGSASAGLLMVTKSPQTLPEQPEKWAAVSTSRAARWAHAWTPEVSAKYSSIPSSSRREGGWAAVSCMELRSCSSSRKHGGYRKWIF